MWCDPDWASTWVGVCRRRAWYRISPGCPECRTPINPQAVAPAGESSRRFVHPSLIGSIWACERGAFLALQRTLTRTHPFSQGGNELYASLRMFPQAIVVGERRVSYASMRQVSFERGFMLLVTRG